MPKRSKSEKIKRYQKKIRKLEANKPSKYNRIVFSSESDSNSDIELESRNYPGELEVLQGTGSEDVPVNTIVEMDNTETRQEPVATVDPELDSTIVEALGDAVEETPKFGKKVHESLARLWSPILRKGLNKEIKEKLLKKFLVPENCPLLQAPKLNPEINSVINDVAKGRDKRVESVQRQLGLGIAALNRGLDLLLTDDKERVQAISFISDSCRILCDLHFIETEARRKFVTPGLDKSFLSLIQDVDRDEMLFGNKLSDSIKASRAIEKQGLQIKKTFVSTKIPSTSVPQATVNRSARPQLNWSGPSRYPPNRGGRGALRKPTSTVRRAPPVPQSKPSTQSRQRAPTQPQ